MDWAAPVHHQTANALGLFKLAQGGTLSLHVPAICLAEAKKVIRERFHPKREYQAITGFARLLHEEGRLSGAELDVVRRVCQTFQGRFENDLSDLENRLATLRGLPGVDVFPLSEPMLERALQLTLEKGMVLSPFDGAILGAVLVRASELQRTGDEVVFATLDADLQPLNAKRLPKSPLADLYAAAGLSVYDDFLLPAAAPGAQGQAP